jgi:hypothetical protein
MTRKKWKSQLKRLLFVLGLLIITVCLVFAGVYLAVVYRPADYDPQPLSIAQQQRVENEGWKKSEEFYNNVHKMEPFTICFEQRMLNNLLGHDEADKFFDKLSPRIAGILHQPQLKLADGSIQMMARISYAGVNFVLTVGFKPAITDTGHLKLVMLPIRVGALHLPEMLIKKHLAQAARALEERGKKYNDIGDSESADDLMYNLVSVLRQLIEKRQVTVKPEFRAVEDKRAELVGIRIDDGHIELDMQPLMMSK